MNVALSVRIETPKHYRSVPKVLNFSLPMFCNIKYIKFCYTAELFTYLSGSRASWPAESCVIFVRCDRKYQKKFVFFLLSIRTSCCLVPFKLTFSIIIDYPTHHIYY